MNEKLEEPSYREAIAFIGDFLGPFYSKDPKQEPEIGALFDAVFALDIEKAASEWPFAESSEVSSCLYSMQRGLNEGNPTEDLIWEYRRLFVGPNPMPAPPWGSVYTDFEMVVFGESTLDLRRWMREVGITRLSTEGTPEDHIGLMLLMMSWIAQYKPAVLEEFLSQHLFTWSSHFLDEVIVATENPFYNGLARLTKLSLEGIQQDLDLIVEYPRYYR
jgi:putative dimethyl sulfoxide reductase chaperone